MPTYTIRLTVLYSILLILPLCLASPSSLHLLPARGTNNGTVDLTHTALTWANVTSNTTSNLLTADPVAVKLGLPWYTSIPGAVFDFFVAFKSITFDWDRNGGVDAPPKLGVSSFASFNFISQCIGLAYTFIQSFSGFVHILENAHRFSYLRVAGASAYVLLFANATKLWTKLVIQSPIHLIAAWITAIFGMLDFIVLSLPKAGQKELYQLWSPWCTTVLASVDSSQDGCSQWSTENMIGADGLEKYFTWTCANSTSLALFEDGVVPEVFNWAFAGLAGLLLLVSFYQHTRYWISRDRKIQYEQKLAGYIAYFLILAVVGLTVWVFFESYEISKPNFINQGIAVCPGISNSTTGNVSYAEVTQSCQCVSVRLPGTVDTVAQALSMDKTNLARLIFNV